MTLRLIHAPLDARAFAAWRGARGFDVDAGAALHALLSGLFGKGALQPFRLFAPDHGAPDLYAYAHSDADALREMAMAVGAPDALAVLRPEAIRAKPMPARFEAGRRLGFDLRVRPVRRLRAPLPDPRNTRSPVIAAGAEIDAFQLAGLRDHAGDPDGMAAAGRTRAAVYADWLGERLRGAATLEDARLTAFQRSRATRPGLGTERRKARIEGPDATLQGTLVVDDPDAFAERLAHGVGRHLAWGYGMLLLRPPSPPC